MLGDACEHISEPRLRINIVELRAAMTVARWAALRAGEELGLSSEGNYFSGYCRNGLARVMFGAANMIRGL